MTDFDVSLETQLVKVTSALDQAAIEAIVKKPGKATTFKETLP